MKRYLYSILIAAAAILCLQACTEKENWEDTADPTEKLLVLLSNSNYVVYSYNQSGQNHVITFHEPKVIDSIRDRYPNGVESLSVPDALVSRVEDSRKTFTVIMRSGKQAVFKRFSEFMTSLPPSQRLKAYMGLPYEVPFTVTASNGNDLFMESCQATGAEVSTSFMKNSGVITITPTEETGSVFVTLSNGLAVEQAAIYFETCYLNITSVPDFFGYGDEYTFSISYETNLPDEEMESLVIDTDPWMEASFGEKNTIDVRIDANDTESPRKGHISVRHDKSYIERVEVEIEQENIPVHKPGMVWFRDGAFKKAALAIADRNGDGEVSFQEAESIVEMNISNTGVHDLAGLEAFKRLEKFDAQNNDIVNADVLKELRYLHWLDLRGNMNLESFDVTGCSMYFEHCEFECTDQLQYTAIRRQVGIAGHIVYSTPFYWYEGSDVGNKHSTHIVDTRVTTDWSAHNRLTQIETHTKGSGKYKLVFTGLGYIDEDINTGTFRRIMDEALNTLFEYEVMSDIRDYLDIYILERLVEKHDQWMFSYRVWRDEYDMSDEYRKKFSVPWRQAQRQLQKEAFAAVTTGNLDDWKWEGSEYEVLLVTLELQPNLNGVYSEITTGPDQKFYWGDDYLNEHLWVLTPYLYGASRDEAFVPYGSPGTHEEIEQSYPGGGYVRTQLKDILDDKRLTIAEDFSKLIIR